MKRGYNLKDRDHLAPEYRVGQDKQVYNVIVCWNHDQLHLGIPCMALASVFRKEHFKLGCQLQKCPFLKKVKDRTRKLSIFETEAL